MAETVKMILILTGRYDEIKRWHSLLSDNQIPSMITREDGIATLDGADAMQGEAEEAAKLAQKGGGHGNRHEMKSMLAHTANFFLFVPEASIESCREFIDRMQKETIAREGLEDYEAPLLDYSKEEISCPACGTVCSSKLEECPECGLFLGLPEGAVQEDDAVQEEDESDRADDEAEPKQG